MSVFGKRIEALNAQIDAEFADVFAYVPMREVVNAEPAPDDTRTGGSAKAILLQPGVGLGSGWSLGPMHDRASSEPAIWFMARGVLADVRRFDRFTLNSAHHNPDMTGTRVYEVGDGPTPMGFGRYKATLVEISGPGVQHPPAGAVPPW